jgi:hypothetical protein
VGFIDSPSFPPAWVHEFVAALIERKEFILGERAADIARAAIGDLFRN